VRLKKLRAQSACAVVLASTVQLRKKKEATTQHGTLYSGKTKISIQHCTTVVILFPIDSMTRNSMASSSSSSDEAEHKKTMWVQGGEIRTNGAGGAVVGTA
jgi:hypothetical protein